MKTTIVFISFVVSFVCCGASTEWSDVSGWDSSFEWNGMKQGLVKIVPMYGVEDPQRMLACVDGAGWILIAAMVGVAVEPTATDLFNVTFYTDSSMDGYHQAWTVAQAGNVVNYDTTHNLDASQYLVHIDPTNPDDNITGPSTLTMGRDSAIYLAFTSNEQYGDPPNSVYYGWVQIGIDTEGNLVALNSACDFDHGSMVVGGGAWEGGVPEPSGGILLLLGAAILGLRRHPQKLLCDLCDLCG